MRKFLIKTVLCLVFLNLQMLRAGILDNLEGPLNTCRGFITSKIQELNLTPFVRFLILPEQQEEQQTTINNAFFHSIYSKPAFQGECITFRCLDTKLLIAEYIACGKSEIKGAVVLLQPLRQSYEKCPHNEIDFFKSRNFDVLLFNPRGVAGSEGHIDEGLGYSSALSIRAAINYLARFKKFAPEKILISAEGTSTPLATYAARHYQTPIILRDPFMTLGHVFEDKFCYMPFVLSSFLWYLMPTMPFINEICIINFAILATYKLKALFPINNRIKGAPYPDFIKQGIADALIASNNPCDCENLYSDTSIKLTANSFNNLDNLTHVVSPVLLLCDKEKMFTQHERGCFDLMSAALSPPL